jgi:hypothetical protein
MQLNLPDLVKKLDNKVKCSACKKIIAEGIIEAGAVNIQCGSCGFDNTIIVSGIPKERFVRGNRSFVEMLTETINKLGK